MEKERLKEAFGGSLALQVLIGIAIVTLLAGQAWWFSFIYVGGNGSGILADALGSMAVA
ncbi:MAG: hypothetical protein V3U30_05450 [Thermoplasmata archaeon]